MKWVTLFLVLVALVVFTMSNISFAVANGNPLNLPAGSWYFIPYSSSSSANALFINIQANGGKTVQVQVDTGSSYTVLASSYIGSFSTLTGAENKYIEYTSDHRREIGTYFSKLSVQFTDAVNSSGTASTLTASVPALGVTSVKKDGKVQTKAPTTAMMGIGFGAPGQISLFNISGVDQGYIVGPYGTGIYVGVTNKLVSRQGFSTLQLTKYAAATATTASSSDAANELSSNQYWNYPQASVQATVKPSGKSVVLPSTTCNLLIDTGYPGLFLGLQDMSTADGQKLPPTSGTIATGVTIKVTPAFSIPLSWMISIGASGAPGAAPSPSGSAQWNSDSGFINTGISSLANYWLFYGGKEGYWGLKAY